MTALLRKPARLVLAVRVLTVAAFVPVLMRLPLHRVGDIVAPAGPRRGRNAQDPLELASLILWLLRAGRPLVRRGCLTRGVTLYYFLSRAGVDVELVFGVGMREDGADGHCWLVRQGEPFLETEDPRPLFSELYRIPGSTRAATA
jgi:hypothetical protein